ncbi:MAG: cytochrome c oxidase subunit II [Sneathiella sp.]|nr:cytochrome c oxidase subunit II [Sneathiella sp.]
MIVALVLIFIALGSVVFHVVNPWWWTEIASNWGYIDDTIVLTFWITGTVFVAVILFMAYCILKFRTEKGRRAHYEPENKKLEIWLSVLTSIGVAGMLAPGLIVWQQYVTVPENASEIEVMGQQWQWNFRLPGKDGRLGKTEIRFVDDDNYFGVDPNDPNGQDDVLIEGDDLHIRMGKPIKFLLRSVDVLHDFYVPQFRAKMDLVPGVITYFWITPIRTGTFDILCAELCGIGHHEMRGSVTVEKDAAFQEWISEQETFEEVQAAALHRKLNKELAQNELEPRAKN